MLRIALVALTLAACAAPAETAPTPHDLWLPDGTAGAAEQARWGLPLPSGFELVELAGAAFATECAELRGGRPCPDNTTGAADIEGNRIIVRTDAAPEMRSETILHEMGHILSGRPGHIRDAEGCPAGYAGDHVMCALGDGSAQWPTEADLDFVLSAQAARGAQATTR